MHVMDPANKLTALDYIAAKELWSSEDFIKTSIELLLFCQRRDGQTEFADTRREIIDRVIFYLGKAL